MERNSKKNIKKDSCKKCYFEYRQKEELQYNQDLGLISKDDYGYYSFKENRIQAVKDYLNKYDTLENFNDTVEGKRLYQTIFNQGDSIFDIAKELGYKLEDICSTVPKNNNDDIAHLKAKINSFIKENNRFPTHIEMQKKLKISSRFIVKNGGIDYFKQLVGYMETQLIDLRGDYNKSIGEYIFANYLCLQGLKEKYLREQHPFPKEEGLFRSDFTFYIEDDKEIHVEIWGVDKNDNSRDYSKSYNEVRIIKEGLYKKHGYKIIFIGIEYDIFSLKYYDIQNKLYDVLSGYFKLNFKTVSYNQLLNASVINDKEIFKRIMKTSTDKDIFPSSREILNYCSSLYLEILKRGYSLNSFANKFGVKLKNNILRWDKQMVFNYFDMIVKENKIINKASMKGKYNNLSNITENFGYITKLKLDYFEYIKEIPKQELEWIINLSNNKVRTSSVYTEDEVLRAKQLLIEYNIK